MTVTVEHKGMGKEAKGGCKAALKRAEKNNSNPGKLPKESPAPGKRTIPPPPMC